jgi:hypothetical protein
MNRSIDVLTDITGIGPRIAEKLVAEGVTDLETLADLSEDDLDRLDVKLGLKGHPRRDDWTGQAKAIIANGGVRPEEIEITDSRDAALAEASAAIKALREELAALKAGGAETAPEESVQRKRDFVRRRRLNRNLDFGQVFGEHNAASYVQHRDGEDVYFNHAGIEILPGETAGDPREGEAEPEHIAKDVGDFNPINFLDGKVDYDFGFVRKALKSRYGRDAKNIREAKKTLHDILRQNH